MPAPLARERSSGLVVARPCSTGLLTGHGQCPAGLGESMRLAAAALGEWPQAGVDVHRVRVSCQECGRDVASGVMPATRTVLGSCVGRGTHILRALLSESSPGARWSLAARCAPGSCFLWVVAGGDHTRKSQTLLRFFGGEVGLGRVSRPPATLARGCP